MTPINTGGFGLQVMPQVRYPDPSVMATSYSNLIPAVSQGMGLVNYFSQIQNQAKQDAINNQLAQIKMQQSQAELARAPILTQIDQANLNRLNQPIRTQIGVDTVRTPVTIGDDVEIPAGYDIPSGFDTQEVAIRQVYNPVTNTTTIERVPVRTISTAENQARTDELAGYRQGLIEDKERAAELAARKEESMAAKRAADVSKIQQGLKSKSLRPIGRGTLDNGKLGFEVMDTKTGEHFTVESSLVPIQTQNSWNINLDGNSLGNSQNKSGASKPDPTSASPSGGLSDIDLGFLNPQVAPQPKSTIGNVDVKDVPISGMPVDNSQLPQQSVIKLRGALAPVMKFDTLKDAQDAAASGIIIPGSKITVGGIPGTWQ